MYNSTDHNIILKEKKNSKKYKAKSPNKRKENQNKQKGNIETKEQCHFYFWVREKLGSSLYME